MLNLILADIVEAAKSIENINFDFVLRNLNKAAHEFGQIRFYLREKSFKWWLEYSKWRSALVNLV